MTSYDCLLTLDNLSYRTYWIWGLDCLSMGIKANSSLEVQDEGSENEEANAPLNFSALFMNSVGSFHLRKSFIQ